MKNNSFTDVIKASVEDRRDLFLATATRLGVPLQNDVVKQIHTPS